MSRVPLVESETGRVHYFIEGNYRQPVVVAGLEGHACPHSILGVQRRGRAGPCLVLHGEPVYRLSRAVLCRSCFFVYGNDSHHLEVVIHQRDAIRR